MKKCFLVCNAHLDPVWLWPWEDGMAEAISTFRVAADFCEANPGFVFNHNESVLYEWVEEHAPELFARIQNLVRLGRWHIAGGAYLQPDPIGASGESMIRQYLVGKSYFLEKFGVEPRTAYNFDSFGHPRGMIQILSGCGFDSYIFCRPKDYELTLPVGPFRWQHNSGAEIIARRSDDNYITQGALRDNMRDGAWPSRYDTDFLFLWGIGNHGGGPSREEYAQFAGMRGDFPDVEFIESTPEAFFEHFLKKHPRESLPGHRGDLKPVFEGCYISMLRVKQTHRCMENLMAQTECLATWAWWSRGHPYPEACLAEAWKGILFAEFHDILPGSGIPSVEADALVRLGHCEEILRRQRVGAMIALLQDEPLAERNRTPIFVFNPHAWEVTQEVEIEYCLDRQYSPDQVIRSLSQGGVPVNAQFEKAEHNLADRNWGEWRQKAVFPVTIPPLSYQRFDADYTVLPPDQIIPWRSPGLPADDRLDIEAGDLRFSLDTSTGLINEAFVGGRRVLASGSAKPLVFADKAHAWETIPEWAEPLTEFRLATPDEAARVRGSSRVGPPVSIIEDGPVRTIIEVIFMHGSSHLVQRYIVQKSRPIIHIDQDIFWDETDRMFSLELCHACEGTQVVAERCYSIDDLTTQASEGRIQDAQHFLRIGNDLGIIPYGPSGFSHRGSMLRLHVLRSIPYSSMDDTPPECDRVHDRYIPRQDQGWRSCRHTLAFGALASTALARTALECHQPMSPFIYFPTSHGNNFPAKRPLVTVDADNVLLVALKKSHQGNDMILRFWEVSGVETQFEFSVGGKPHPVRIGANGLQTFRLDHAGRLVETDLIERMKAKEA